MEKMTPVERLENYMNENELSQSRTPEEYIFWFEKKLDDTKGPEFRESAILRRGSFNIFYKELFPLYRLLQHKQKEWRNAKITYARGNQNYDVIVESDSANIPKYIEITTTDMDTEEHDRMVSLVAERVVGLEDEAKEESVENQIVKNLMRERIDGKVRKEWPVNTALLVYITDTTTFRYDRDVSKREMNTFLDSVEIQWQKTFSALYVVGDQSFYERLRIDNGN